jgi:hypothetical protein
MPSDFHGLAQELLNNVLERLVGPDRPDPTPRVLPKMTVNSYTWRIRNKPTFDTAILAANNYLHTVSKSCLDITNKWIIFDIDNIHLLLPWIFPDVSVTLIDPEADYAIPEGILQARVKQRLSNSVHATWLQSRFGTSQPRRQIVLVQLHHFETFLQCLRVSEFTDGVRVLPGQVFDGPPYDKITFHKAVDADGRDCYIITDDREWPAITANAGFHGLSIRVIVNPTYPEQRTKRLLELFRIFHGSLNEVTIIGSSDPLQARSIEASITAPRDAANTSFHEAILHVVKLTRKAGEYASDGSWLCAFVVNTEACEGIIPNHRTFDKTPWTGKIEFSGPQADFSQRRFETMLLVICQLNEYFYSIPGDQRLCGYRTHNEAIRQRKELIRLLDLPTVSPEFRAFAMLLVALHLFFDVRVVSDTDTIVPENYVNLDNAARAEATQQLMDNIPECWDVVRTGMDIVENTEGLFEHLPTGDHILFFFAHNMVNDLRKTDVLTNKSTMAGIIDNWRKQLVTIITRQPRPFKWMVHESLIPSALVVRGVLNYMTDCSLMTADDKKKSLLVNVFTDVDRRHGVLYCI